LIGRAFDLLTKQEGLLGPSLKTLVRVLNFVDWDVIAKGNPEAWIDFYELFLSVYDNRLRKLTGSYYTPPEVVRAMVRLCDEALKSRFDKPAGLADAEVQIADPAVGSGTFLLGLLRHMADWKEADEGKGAVGPFITEAAKRLFGFELQFGPFAVAQLRLHDEMIELNASGSPHLFVTDTLGDHNQAFERGTGIYAALSKSQEEANEVKRTQPITVVVGNPPYKEKTKGKGSWIEQGSGNVAAPLDDWRPPKKMGRWRARQAPPQPVHLFLAMGGVEGLRKRPRQSRAVRDRLLHHCGGLSERTRVSEDARAASAQVRRNLGHRLFARGASTGSRHADLPRRPAPGVHHDCIAFTVERRREACPRALSVARERPARGEVRGAEKHFARRQRLGGWRIRLAGTFPASAHRRLGRLRAAGLRDRRLRVGRDAGTDVDHRTGCAVPGAPMEAAAE
jgi:hypothetical protein